MSFYSVAQYVDIMNQIAAPDEILERISSLMKVEGGSDEVYKVIIDDSEFILKLFLQNDKELFRSEPLIQEWLRPRVSFNIPHVEEYQFSENSRDYILLDFIDGLNPETDLGCTELEKTVRETSDALTELSTVETPFKTAGAIQATENSIKTTSNKKWRPYILSSVKNLQSHVPNYFNGQMDDIIEFSGAYNSHIPIDKTQLIHGDFRFENILVSTDGSINAVLDWGQTYSGDIHYNYVRTAYFMKRDLESAGCSSEVVRNLFRNCDALSSKVTDIYQLHVMAVEMKNMSWWYTDEGTREKRKKWIQSQVEDIIDGRGGFISNLS